MDEIFLVNSASFQNVEVSYSLKAGPGVTVDLSAASSVAGNFTASYIAQGSNTTASVAFVSTSASYALSASSDPANANVFAGLTTTPYLFDDVSNFEFCVGEANVNLYDNAAGYGYVQNYYLTPVTFSVPTATSASFIYATTNGESASYGITVDYSLINLTNIVPITTIYRADEDVHWLPNDNEGLALANKIELRLLQTQKFAWESGLTLVDTGSNDYFISAGRVWFGVTPLVSADFDSRNTESIAIPVNYSETHWVYHENGEYIIPTASAIITRGKYNNAYWDDGTNLQPLSDGYYVCNYFYRILGGNVVDTDTFIVLGQNQYADIASAENDKVPSPIPNVLSDVGILVGRMIVQSSSLSASKVESAFTTQFGSEGVTSLPHNSLIGIRGGTGGEYYHMTYADYVGTGTGLMVRADSAVMTNLKASGSLFGTASHALTSVSASYANSSSRAETAGVANSISFVPVTSISASWASSSVSASLAENAKHAYAINFVPVAATSASWPQHQSS